MQMDEVSMSIRLLYSRDIIYRTELLRQITEFSLEEYLKERDMFFDCVNEETIDESGHAVSTPRKGYFATLLRATQMTNDLKVMRSVNSLFHCMGLYPACAQLQRLILRETRLPSTLSPVYLCILFTCIIDLCRQLRNDPRVDEYNNLGIELESLAVALIKDESENFGTGLVDAARDCIHEAISIRKELKQRNSDVVENSELCPLSNNISLINNIYLLSCIYDEMVDELDCNSWENQGVDKAIETLSELESVSLSDFERNYANAIILPKLAMLHDQSGDWANSKKIFEMSLAIQRNFLGDNHPVLIQTLSDCGLMLMKSGATLLDSMKYLVASCKLRFEFYLNCSDKYQGFTSLAKGFMAQVPLFLALRMPYHGKTLIEKAYGLRCASYGVDSIHTSIVECYVEYGLLCKRLGKYDLAVAYLEESLKVCLTVPNLHGIL